MEVTVEHGNIETRDVDALVVNLFAGVHSPGGATGAVDRALGGAISELIAHGDFTGKAGEVAVLYSRGKIPARRVLVVGLGERASLNTEAIRRASATAVSRARELKCRRVATIVHGAGIGGLQAATAAQATVEGAMLALYQYRAPKAIAPDQREVEGLALVEYDAGKLAAIEQGLRAARAIVAGSSLARDLVNLPPNVATPRYIAKQAKHVADEFGLDLTVGGRKWAGKRSMGAFLAVAQGAGEPPRFIVLEYNGKRTDLDTVVLVGKGITFDTGGISIKPSEHMEAMKSDMAGAAAVLGAMRAVAELQLPLRLIGITPCTENMPDANAFRPADVLTAGNGKTIEIISTDAEGRLILADALVYAGRYQPKAVIDLATLTGACVVALGHAVAAGLFCTDDWLRDALVAAAQETHERIWPLPLYDDYRETIKSEVADMKNSGGRVGGVGASAVFLQEFTDYPWAHLDIAGMALHDKARPYTPAGGSGFGVRLLVEFLRRWPETHS